MSSYLPSITCVEGFLWTTRGCLNVDGLAICIVWSSADFFCIIFLSVFCVTIIRAIQCKVIWHMGVLRSEHSDFIKNLYKKNSYWCHHIWSMWQKLATPSVPNFRASDFFYPKFGHSSYSKIWSNLSHYWRTCIDKISYNKKSNILHKFLNKTSCQIWCWKSQMAYNLERRE